MPYRRFRYEAPSFRPLTCCPSISLNDRAVVSTCGDSKNQRRLS